MLKNFFKWLCLGLVILALIVFGFYSFWLYPRYSVPILMYHSIDYSRSLLSVTPENFEGQMRFIKENGYHVIPFDEAIEGMKINRKFPHNVVVITFDDGYENNYTKAYPILKKYGFPATIFLITHKMGTKGFLLPYTTILKWDEVKEMSHHGITFGSHTQNHFYLPDIQDQDVLWHEIAGSKADIEKQLALPVDYLSYPSGGFTSHIESLVKKAGYKAACTTSRGYDLLNRTNFYDTDRISVRNGNPYKNLWAMIRFKVKILGYYNAFKKGQPGN